MTISRHSLPTLVAFAEVCNAAKAEVVAHCKLCSAHRGKRVTLQFEDKRAVLRNTRKMLHIEKIFGADGGQSESVIDTDAALIPDGGNCKRTRIIEDADAPGREQAREHRRELARLIGTPDRLFVEAESHARGAASAHEHLKRTSQFIASAGHFVGFEFSAAATQACAPTLVSSPAAATPIVWRTASPDPTRLPAWQVPVVRFERPGVQACTPGCTGHRP